MPTEFRNGFTTRYRGAILLFASLATVAVLVLAYRLSAPRTGATTTASGERISESDVLQVGALPVT